MNHPKKVLHFSNFLNHVFPYLPNLFVAHLGELSFPYFPHYVVYILESFYITKSSCCASKKSHSISNSPSENCESNKYSQISISFISFKEKKWTHLNVVSSISFQKIFVFLILILIVIHPLKSSPQPSTSQKSHSQKNPSQSPTHMTCPLII